MTTAANSGAGGRDWDTKLRRDEVVRCMAVLGWSWPVLSQRISVGVLKGALAIKMCKREISDSDLEWLSSLAAAVEATPRPKPVAALQDDEAPAATEGLVQEQREPSEGTTALVEHVEQRVIEAIVAQYRSPMEGWDGWSADEVRAARVSLSELLSRLGWLDRARKLLADTATRSAVPAGAPAVVVPRSFSWAAGQPVVASQARPAPRREPFA